MIFLGPWRFREGRRKKGSFEVETALGARGPLVAPGGGIVERVEAEGSESVTGIPESPGLDREK